MSLLLSDYVRYDLDSNYEEPPPLPSEIAERFSYVRRPIKARQRLVEKTTDLLEYLVKFSTSAFYFGQEYKVRLSLFCPKAERDGRRWPAVIILPVLGGEYRLTRRLARTFAVEGIATVYLHLSADIFQPSRSVQDMEKFLREGAIEVSKVIDWLESCPFVDAKRIGAIGVSLGGIRLSVLLAAEKRLMANVVALAGANLAGVFHDSRQRQVQAYRKKRKQEERVSNKELTQHFAQALKSDPGALAPFVDARRVLMILALLDNKVPIRYGRELHSKMGGPEVIYLPTGHYTSVLLAPYLEKAITEYFKKHFVAIAREPHGKVREVGQRLPRPH
ncbi:MAG: hypothetical protein AMS15_07180 [Planctomycetes bacterium DG_23]|nr:MAG: hypothetical protein AMS15_07180 [Planctomycetes bacterium DG_23]